MDKIVFPDNISLSDLNQSCIGNMGEVLGIEFIEITPYYLQARMPVDHRTTQPMRILHGGASVALAETIGSVAANCAVNPETHFCVGLEINANHVRSATSGWVIATCTPLHIGGTTQVWDIKITTEGGALVCISRLTMAVLAKKKAFTEEMSQFKIGS
jgi:1,4-dihydroxy-2-naphthoyl-CoA hydrolase